MLENCLSYTVGVIEAIADLFANEPFVYVVGFILAALVFDIINKIAGR